MSRLATALRAGVVEFKRAWDDHERIIAERFVEREGQKHAAVHSAYAELDPSDQHFLQSFINNLEAKERPDRERVKRFFAVVKTMPKTAQTEVLKKAMEKCPLLLMTKAFRDYSVGNCGEPRK